MNELHRTVDLFDHLRPEIMIIESIYGSSVDLVWWIIQLIDYIIWLTKSPTPGIVMESLTGNATLFARMMLNANDPKTAVMGKKLEN